MKPYLKLMRVHHYIKNLLVFAALGCSGQLFSPEKLKSGVFGFLAFSMLSSVIYIVNDTMDAEKDRLHPQKCRRPIAAGIISKKRAWTLAIALFALAVLFNGLTFRPVSSALLLLYGGLNLAYSFGLKNIPIIDVTILVAGFLIRILYGAIVTEITISNWLYLTVIAVSYYFALGKRRNELIRHGDANTRTVLKAYPKHFLDNSMNMCLTLTVVFYALWSMDERTVSLYGTQRLVYTVPMVLLIIMKYSLNIERGSDGDPVEVLLHDKVLLLLVLVYMAAMFAILYLMHG